MSLIIHLIYPDVKYSNNNFLFKCKRLINIFSKPLMLETHKSLLNLLNPFLKPII